MQLKFFHDVKCIIFIIEVLLLSPFINNFFGIILTYSTNHDILYHKSHWTCRLIANLLQKWLVITVRPTTSVKEKSTKEATAPQHTRFILPSVSPDKILRLYCVGGIFLYGKRTLKISWADRTWYCAITSHFLWASRTTPLQNRGRNFVRSKRRSTYTSSGTLYLFLRLNNLETITQKQFWAQR